MTVTEMMEAIGNALSARDTDRLYELSGIINGWLLPETERVQAITLVDSCLFILEEYANC